MEIAIRYKLEKSVVNCTRRILRLESDATELDTEVLTVSKLPLSLLVQVLPVHRVDAMRWRGVLGGWTTDVDEGSPSCRFCQMLEEGP